MNETGVKKSLNRILKADDSVLVFPYCQPCSAGVHDIVGCKSTTITQDMVGKKVGLFISIEVKRDDAKLTYSPGQALFARKVEAVNGLPFLVHNKTEMLEQFTERGIPLSPNKK